MSYNTVKTCLYQDLQKAALALETSLRTWRRDAHRHPETAWTEYYTAALVATQLQGMGLDVRLGDKALCPERRMDLPPEADMEQARQRALAWGANPHLVAHMGKGCTAVIAELDCRQPGDQDEPVLALRVDMDALPLPESRHASHPPQHEAYASTHQGCMHACGHDLHLALALGLAQLLLPLRKHLRGRVRFIFQPAEEGTRGAQSLLTAVEDVDYLLGLHVGLKAKPGQLVCTATNFLATTKLRATFHGRRAHAGLAPQEGRNALLAACSATLALHALPRHGSGETRVGVGTLDCRCPSNVVPDEALLLLETRGDSTELNAWMEEEALRILQEAATLWNCTVQVHKVGYAPGASGDRALAALIAEEGAGLFADIIPELAFGASEDFSLLLDAAQQHGGQGAYLLLGADKGTGHHTSGFHVDEALLQPGAEVLARVVLRLLWRQD